MYSYTLVSSSRNKMSIKSLMIPFVESQYTQEYIANVFWSQYIAKVSMITLIPYIKNSTICSIAYISIAEWCDSEAAYNFIQRLNNPDKETRIVHYEDEWWPILLNTHNNGDINVGSYTRAFDSSYFVKEVQEPRVVDEEELEDRPIKGLKNDYYTVDEALEHLWVLNQQLDTAWAEIQSQRETTFLEIEAELLHFENELRIHEALSHSSNVTLRAHQLGKRKFEEDFLHSHPMRAISSNCDDMFI